MIDLRSDTVTIPSGPMREVMAQAEVGDDVYGEDPTINALEAKAADILGKEAAVFVPTGTMANQIAAKVHTTPASEIILAANSHVFTSESGAVAAISGVTLNLRSSKRGLLDAKDVAGAVRADNLHMPPSKLVWIENTHNAGGGAVYPLTLVKQLSEVARANLMALHMDGARLFNAVVASGTSAEDYAGPCDSLSFCLSKGLGCPVGSVLAGKKGFISEARRWRKILGGGMRQAGILAAAGIYALDNNIKRLAEDHANAKILAEALAGHPMVRLDAETVETNIIVTEFDETVDAVDLATKCAAEGVLFLPNPMFQNDKFGFDPYLVQLSDKRLKGYLGPGSCGKGGLEAVRVTRFG